MGTIEVSADDRRAVARFYGYSGLAPREMMRSFILSNGTEEIVNQLFSMQQEEESDARERHYDAVNNTMLRPDRR